MSSAQTPLHHNGGYTTGRIERWTASDPCGVCGGHPSSPQGRGERCYGFRSSDGKYLHCTREEHAGSLRMHNGGNTFAHRASGDCRCGLRHGYSMSRDAIRSPRKAVDDRPKPWSIPDAHVETFHRYELGGELQFEIARIWKHHRRQYGGTKTLPRYVGEDGSWYFGQGKWKGRKDKPLYRQDEALKELLLGGKVFICEGERDADALWEADCIAVCNPDGAGSFREAQAARLIAAMRGCPPALTNTDTAGRHARNRREKTSIRLLNSEATLGQHTEMIEGDAYLVAAEIEIIADNDSAGIDHARAVWRMIAVDEDLRGRVWISRPSGEHKDIADLLAGGAS